MTEQEIEQDRNCHYDLQSSISDEDTRKRLAQALGRLGGLKGGPLGLQS